MSKMQPDSHVFLPISFYVERCWLEKGSTGSVALWKVRLFATNTVKVARSSFLVTDIVLRPSIPH